MSGRFELRQDEDTGRRYWFGGEDGWKDPTEIGVDGVLTVSAEHFKVGTVLVFTAPSARCRHCDDDIDDADCTCFD